MKKTYLVFLLFLVSGILNAQPGPPGGLVINHGWPICCDSACLFDWDNVPGATSYGLQVMSSSLTIINVSGLPVSEYTVPPFTFTPNSYYYCRINAAGPGGQGPWSTVYNFNTAASPPNPPALIFPPDSAYFISLTPVFDWTDVSGATMYRLQVSTSPLFTNTNINISGLVNSGYAVPSGALAICTRYYWRVAASNGGGQGSWSIVRTFVTICPSGVNQISSEIPIEYKLYQNYPNPFNPSTNIKYQITNNKLTTLKIYDILGREVITLVNEYQKAGTYEVQFSINQYTINQIPSGLYYYKIHTGDFTDTKRMVLIK
jgi:hypothetical protein